MNTLYLIIEFSFNLYLMVVLLRLWLQFARADFYNPFSQFVVKATHPIVGPLRRLLPSIGNLDTATLALAFLVAGIKVTALGFITNSPNLNPLSIGLTAALTVLAESLSLIMYILILRAILSWVSQGYNPIEAVMHQLTEPMLAPIRRIIPPMGGLDLSIMLAIFLIMILNSLIFQDLLNGAFR